MAQNKLISLYPTELEDVTTKEYVDGQIAQSGYGLVTSTTNGLMSSTDKIKLDGVAEGSQPNIIESISGTVNDGTPTGATNPSNFTATITNKNANIALDLSRFATAASVTTVSNGLAQEITDRASGDTALGTRIDTVTGNVSSLTTRVTTNETNITNLTTNKADKTDLGNYVLKSGDTMTGLLVLSADPSANLGAATKQYVDNRTGVITTDLINYVAKSGSTMTGGLTLNANPTTDLGAATKQYVDQSITNIASNALKFVGFISATAPTTGVREGNLWYSGTTTNTTFPWQVYTYTSGAWSSTTTAYTPTALDGWERLSDTTSWYYFGDHWNQLDFAGSTFNATQFETINNVVNLRAGGISNAQIADNANIAQSKISGLTTALSTITTNINGKANDADVVKLTTDQTVAGIKTFSSSPVVPTPTTSGQTANKAYVDTKANSGDTVNLTGNQSVSGVKTFNASPVVPNPTNSGDTANKNYVDTQVATKATDTAVVHLAGAETITGVKTFNASPIVPTPTTSGQTANKSYVDTGLGTKQNTLTAGTNITISGNTISGRAEWFGTQAEYDAIDPKVTNTLYYIYE
jgi:hypothetical protein